MDVRQLRYFLAVVDHGSVHRAARELFVAQPSVSQALRALERDLGAELFHRTGRRLVLTAAGEGLVEPARDVLAGLRLARDTVEAVEGLRGGRLLISAMPSQAVSPLAGMIGRFAARHPDVEVVVRAGATPPEVLDAVRVGAAELGVLGAARRPEPAGMVVTPLATQRFVLVAAAPGDLPAGGPVSPAALAGVRLIAGQRGTVMRRAADDIVRAAPGSRIAVEVEHREAVLPLVLAGVGVAVLSESWRQLALDAGLAVRDLDSPEVLHVCLVHRTGRLSPAAREFTNQ
ncbi:LysR family transcriptional regulator [Actinophytocola xinjiangensis]|uniref:LysR family transcriptional regulator n=1 Tax=Actinophytocola xinjiangensis TaxID=485602 RepID=A0A7Z0WQ33_9PSEU|nr:LysR family transcriptional regulator [Actinophytocola xinjiangensis]OLF10248.1 LysR family transcriptional regulator [Actinophytocola xinjiangensis]